ncbi:DUF881 domain-containing protein [Cellulomonas composti]|uniref:Uncharacterized protein n=1 Tax=Cellulomonas composti TaxID=266130 RepID=A0A511J6C8_9CELL|nr:DUF881 domain-containing protein [Cellulomonas composti]GEL93555.1 hypothetical protein CCO02nite_02130 [Cellulomonas composti]
MTQRHGQTGPPRPPDASMTLLTEFYRRPLDPGYAEAARRRAAGQAPRRTPAGVVATAVVALALGLVVAAATLALRQPAGAAQHARDVLESSIEQRTAEVADLQGQADDLSAHVAALQQALVGPGESALQDQLAAGAVEAGSVDVTGKGLRVVLTDAPPDADGEVDEDSRVQDIDLQVLVNGLWAAGAEAIAINDQRLTATTAIRAAGSAVLVDLVPLSSPYEVDVIGDPVTMQTDLARSTAGQHLATLRSTFGIGVDISSEGSLVLPGAGAVVLHHATVPDDALPDALREPAASPTPDTTLDTPASPTGADPTATGATIAADHAGGGLS